MSEQQEAPSFSIEKLYLKDLSVEVPNAPRSSSNRMRRRSRFSCRPTAATFGSGAYEVVLTVTVTARIGEKTVFLVEIGQAGIFRIFNVPDENLEPLIAVACPNILFPYAREVVSDAVTRRLLAGRAAAGQLRRHVHGTPAGSRSPGCRDRRARSPRPVRSFPWPCVLSRWCLSRRSPRWRRGRRWPSNIAPSTTPPRRSTTHRRSRAKPLFVIKRFTPVEPVVSLEGWTKVRDAEGGLAWIEKKHLSEQRTVLVTASLAQVRREANDDAPLVFEAQKGVALEFVEPAVAGWARCATATACRVMYELPRSGGCKQA